MTEKSPADKARVKPGTRVAIVNPVAGVVESLGLPEDTEFVDAADAQIVLLFVTTRAELDARMPTAVASLGPGAVLWALFRKGSRAAGLDMNRDSIWAIAERLGMRPLGIIGVDEAWSAFRLRPGA